MRKEVLALIIAGLVYSLCGFAYMHKTFPSKDVFKMLIDRLDSIDEKIDKVQGYLN
jgi:hypothetical protein